MLGIPKAEALSDFVFKNSIPLGIQSPPDGNGTPILCWGRDWTPQSFSENMTGCLGFLKDPMVPNTLVINSSKKSIKLSSRTASAESGAVMSRSCCFLASHVGIFRWEAEGKKTHEIGTSERIPSESRPEGHSETAETTTFPLSPRLCGDFAELPGGQSHHDCGCLRTRPGVIDPHLHQRVWYPGWVYTRDPYFLTY